MRSLHIANVDFEFELAEEKDTSLPLEQALRKNPIVQQLQFLPLLYADPEEGFCVSNLPLNILPSCYLLSDPQWTCSHDPALTLHSWGASRRVAEWALAHHLTYTIPPWEVVRQVNSKAFSFLAAPPLPGAELITSPAVLEKWMKRVEGPKVLKKCFGLSGQGHLLLPAPAEKIARFCHPEWKAHRPLIGEPWVARKLDFSTQWLIHEDRSIQYLGATILMNNIQGKYEGTRVGNEEKLFGIYFPQLELHKEKVQATLNTMATLGFFGHVGIDAMIWGNEQLQPIVEINARKTMGWVALQIAKRLFANQTIQVSYKANKGSRPLLPEGIVTRSGVIIRFHRNLFVDVLA